MTLHDYIKQGRIIRGKWTGTDTHGRETACLLAALSPAVARTRDPSSCPIEIMPAWLAHLTPWIDDAGTEERWPAVIRRYADLAARWRVLDAAAWRRAEYATRAACVRETIRHIADFAAVAACERVAELCDGVARGDDVSAADFREAKVEAAWAAGTEMQAWTVEMAAKAASAWEPPSSVKTEAEFAASLAAVNAEALALAEEEEAETADRIITVTLDAIEREITAAEKF